MSELDIPATTTGARDAARNADIAATLRRLNNQRTQGLQRAYHEHAATVTPGATISGQYATGKQLALQETGLVACFMECEVFMSVANSPITLIVAFLGGGTESKPILYAGNVVPTSTWQPVASPGTDLISGAATFPSTGVFFGLPADTYDIEIWGVAPAGNVSSRNHKLWVVAL